MVRLFDDRNYNYKYKLDKYKTEKKIKKNKIVCINKKNNKSWIKIYSKEK